MTKIMQKNKLQDEASTIPAKEIKGQRVVSYKQIAELHQVDVRTIRRNYERNADKFIQGVDYYQIKETNPDSDNLSHTRNYFTESGYLMLVKSLTDDLSWEVQRMLVNTYFKSVSAEKGHKADIVNDPTRKITQYIKTSNWARLKNLSTDLSISTGQRVTVNMLLDKAIELLFSGDKPVPIADFEEILSSLEERMQQLVYYRRLGLTQIEAGKLLGVGEGTIKNMEAELRKYGYDSPHYRGMRSFGMIYPDTQSQYKSRKVINTKVWRLIHEIRNQK